MLICPECKTKLQNENNNYYCCNCAFETVLKDDIIFFSMSSDSSCSDYNPDGLNFLNVFEEKHFWFKQRKLFIKHLFNKYISKESSILEIGSGTGNIASLLSQEGYNIAAGDIHTASLVFSKNNGIKSLYQFDLNKPPFQSHFDTIVLFDVLEHIEDDILAVKSIHSMLKSNGKVIVTVPAHMFLWSHYDIIAKHKRRYSQKNLKNVFTKCGFKIIEAKNLFVLILPLLLFRTLKNNKDKPLPSLEEITRESEINPFFNSLLDKITAAEFFILKYFPSYFGGSIILVAQKIG